MSLITLFEHQTRTYTEIGLSPTHPILEQLDRLNSSYGSQIVTLGRREIRANQFVGVTRLGDTTLQILPKIDYDPLGDAEAPEGSIPHLAAVRSATRNLLHMLSYTHDLRVQEQNTAQLLAHNADWVELLTRLLASELHRLMLDGLEHHYSGVEETAPVIRGRWLVSRQLALRPYTRHLFEVAYDDFSADTSLNQVFKFVVERLLRHTADSINRSLLGDIREWLLEVREPREVSREHLDGVLFTRLNERYRFSYNLARLFIENRSLQLTAGHHEAFALILDMNRLFEEFVSRFLTRYRVRILPETWCDVRIDIQSQGRAYYLVDKLPGRQPVFRLVPDITLVSRPSMPLLIVDTKYKRLDARAKQLGVAQDDVYQLLAYAVRLNCPRTLIIYPQSGGSGKVRVDFEFQGLSNSLTVATIDLQEPLDRPDSLVQELTEILTRVSDTMY